MSASTDDLEPRLRATMKKELRRAMNATRSLLPKDARAARDASITARLSELDVFSSARVVAGYVAARGECDPASALAAVRARGAAVVLPRVDLAAVRIDWKRCAEGSELVHGAFGILEPRAEAETVDPEAIDLVLVPGVAFDVAGNRLGQGKGFYDRALEHTTRARFVGLCFDFQLVDELPAEPHDRPMHGIVTDSRVIALR